MRSADVVNRLATVLPFKTDQFTRTIPVLTVVKSLSEDIVTVTCQNQHGLAVGRHVAIVGAKVPIAITSLTRVGTVGTMVLATKHDMTPRTHKSVVISGANQANFNGTFTTLQYVNATTITFTMVNSGATSATGAVLENGESALRQYDNAYAVTEVLSLNIFRVAFTVPSLPNPIGAIEVRADARVTALATTERMVASYTEKAAGEVWAFVVLGDAVASKDRRIDADSTANFPRSTEYRQQVVHGFTVYVAVPTSETLGGRQARDLCEDLFRPVCQSLLSAEFDSGLFAGKQGRVVFISHGTFSYDGATYWHAYEFQLVADIYFEDTVGPDLDVAFRQIDLVQFPDLPGGAGTGLQSLSVSTNLETP